MKGFKTKDEHFAHEVSVGRKLGFKTGGKVTSGEFDMKKGTQDSMDHGVQPAKEGTSQQEIEAGGTKKLRPGYEKGGEARMTKAQFARKLKRDLGSQFTEREFRKAWERYVKSHSKGALDQAKEALEEHGEKGIGKLKGKSAKWLEEHGIKKGGPMRKKYAKGGYNPEPMVKK